MTYIGRGIHPDHVDTEIQIVLPVGKLRSCVLANLKLLGFDIMYLPTAAEKDSGDLPTYTVGPS